MKTIKATTTLCLLCLPLFCFTGSACASGGTKSETETVKGSGTYVTKDIPVTQFTGIKIKCKADVVYTQQAGDATLQVCTSDNFFDLLDIRVENGTLVISFKKGTKVSYNKLEVSASSLTLENIVLSGSGSFTVPDGLQSERLDCMLSGSGKVKLESLACDKIDVTVTGSGDIDLGKVTATRTEAEITGSGNIVMEGDMKRAEYIISGSGKIAANALTADEVEATIAGSGSIVLDGNADSAGYSITGSGKVEADELTVAEVKASIAGSGSITCHADKLLKVNCPGSGKVGYKGSPLLNGDTKKAYKL